MTSTYSTDIVIFGGGVAGLWLLNRLRSNGFHAILLEADTLGGGQTIASQGIIHGGLKYALSGSFSAAAQAIAGMPARWRACLQGEGDIDLRGCRLRSENYYMWSQAGFRSRLKTFLGSKSLRGRVEAVDKSAYPEFFKRATAAGTLYQLPDFVIDTESLLAELIRKQENHIYRIDARSLAFYKNNAGDIDHLTVSNGDHSLRIESQQFVFCAGEGNEGLVSRAGLLKPRSQIRPLHMVYVKRPELPALYVHCIGGSFSLTPRLTITSHAAADGSMVWYLGGELAEAGINRSAADQVAAATALLRELFPWLHLGDAQWGCFTINRAEAKLDSKFRPDDALFIEEANVLVAWPTKLSLAPSLADKLIEHLAAKSITAIAEDNTVELDKVLAQPKIATALWN
ncbi:MAG TPA: hypothetical protein DCS89_10770 [Gammaproteobacteria bacterium]|nr:hypothetical protein [Gammaproteobacteria bacterium]HAT27490.1 hypothetical protein [Gammaproteobacteria bacterium]